VAEDFDAAVVRREEPLRDDDDDLRVEARVVPPLRSAARISSLATALVSCGRSLTRKDAMRSCLRNSRRKRAARG